MKQRAMISICVVLAILAVFTVIDLTKARDEKEPTANTEPTGALRRYEEKDYYTLSKERGLTVFVWEPSQGQYLCGLAEGLGVDEVVSGGVSVMSIVGSQGVSIEKMREILATYGLSEDRIAVEPCSDITSSYVGRLGEYREDNWEFVRKLIFPD